MLLAALTLAALLAAAPMTAPVPATAPADSLFGTWKITGDVVGNAINQTCTFRQTGTTLAGTCTIEGGAANELAGEIKDGKFTFWHAGGEYNGEALTMIWTIGTITPTEMKGTLLVKPFDAPGTFTAVPAPKP